MRKKEILDYWVGQYGGLSPASRERFLRLQEVRRLSAYPDDLVKRAIRSSNLLADAVNLAAILNNPLKDLPPEPRFTDSPAPAAPRHRPDDSALLHKMGPTQLYEDDF